MLNTIKVQLGETKKCVLNFLRQLVRDEISLMLNGDAFQARGPAMKKALSVK